jgi:hypothetical protein
MCSYYQMTEQMLQLQSREEAEHRQMQNVADSIDDNTTSNVEQLLEVIRYPAQLLPEYVVELRNSKQ